MTLKEAKEGFFDRQKVIDAVGKAAAGALSRGGSLIRADSQRSIKYEEESSQPGHPPHAHRTIKITRKDPASGLPRQTKAGKVRMYAVSPLREGILFSWDANTRSVVVGPTRIREKIGIAPKVLEHGGQGKIVTTVRQQKTAGPQTAGPKRQLTQKQIAAIRRKQTVKQRQVRTVNIAPRPYMGPALERKRNEIPRLFKDTLRAY